MPIKIELAKRMEKLPEYPFKELDRKKQEQIDKGVDIISFAIGDPDSPTPEFIVESAIQALRDTNNHHYPTYQGELALRKLIARWYLIRYGVDLDPENEVLVLIGAKEGIAHLPIALVNPGDKVLVPNPGYPVYEAGTIMVDGIPISMPLLQRMGFLPDIRNAPEDARLMWLNYPNNPTGATAYPGFFGEVVSFAKRTNTMIAHDFCYADVYEGLTPTSAGGLGQPISFLQIPGAKDVGIEFHSFSKTFNMTGWRIGFAIGNAEIIAALGTVKSNVDSGVFKVAQKAAISALSENDAKESRQAIWSNNRHVNGRRKRALERLSRLGIKGALDGRDKSATFYIWCRVPGTLSSLEFVTQILERAGVLFTPGTAFGSEGEGFFRIALTVSGERIYEAFDRIESKCADLF